MEIPDLMTYGPNRKPWILLVVQDSSRRLIWLQTLHMRHIPDMNLYELYLKVWKREREESTIKEEYINAVCPIDPFSYEVRDPYLSTRNELFIEQWATLTLIRMKFPTQVPMMIFHKSFPWWRKILRRHKWEIEKSFPEWVLFPIVTKDNELNLSIAWFGEKSKQFRERTDQMMIEGFILDL